MTIAIVDTGVDYNPPDLVDEVLEGWDFTDNNNNSINLNEHGTHCAEITATITNRGMGIAGMSPNVKMSIIKFQC